MPAVTEPPKDTAVPLIVILEFANLAFAIEPANWAFVTLVFGNVIVLLDKSNELASLAAVTFESVILAVVTASACNFAVEIVLSLTVIKAVSLPGLIT